MFGTLSMDLNIQYAVPRQNTLYFSNSPKTKSVQVYLFTWNICMGKERQAGFLKAKRKRNNTKMLILVQIKYE